LDHKTSHCIYLSKRRAFLISNNEIVDVGSRRMVDDNGLSLFDLKFLLIFVLKFGFLLIGERFFGVVLEFLLEVRGGLFIEVLESLFEVWGGLSILGSLFEVWGGRFFEVLESFLEVGRGLFFEVLESLFKVWGGLFVEILEAFLFEVRRIQARIGPMSRTISIGVESGLIGGLDGLCGVGGIRSILWSVFVKDGSLVGVDKRRLGSSVHDGLEDVLEELVASEFLHALDGFFPSLSPKLVGEIGRRIASGVQVFPRLMVTKPVNKGTFHDIVRRCHWEKCELLMEIFVEETHFRAIKDVFEEMRGGSISLLQKVIESCHAGFNEHVASIE